MVILSDPNKQELASFISDVLWSLCLFLFLKTNPDFETIYAVPNRVSNVATSAFKSIMENGQSPKDEPAVFRGTISSSPTDSDKLSPVSTPRGKKIMIFTHIYKAFIHLRGQFIDANNIYSGVSFLTSFVTPRNISGSIV